MLQGFDEVQIVQNFNVSFVNQLPLAINSVSTGFGVQ